jgi:hypothetical protein
VRVDHHANVRNRAARRIDVECIAVVRRLEHGTVRTPTPTDDVHRVVSRDDRVLDHLIAGIDPYGVARRVKTGDVDRPLKADR